MLMIRCNLETNEKGEEEVSAAVVVHLRRLRPGALHLWYRLLDDGRGRRTVWSQKV